MDRRKRRTSSISSESDDLALVKAAAWAWYQHGSGGPDARPPPAESDVASRSSQRPPRPSRYQIEARATAGTVTAAAGSDKTPPRLLDLYEIEWITKELERLISASTKGGADRRKEVAPPTAEGKRSGKKSGGNGGFFGWHAMAICGSVGETVDPAAVVGRRRTKPAEVV
ncbi:uncharacterized protein [Typha latifolia]|uniref:uncharacterized protein n=1 Tax=Typha latifolia TaxID=4733 RepID=UPI003C2B66FD